MIKEFNIVIGGVGGQGSVTLAYVLAQAAFLQGYDVKTCELHGLAQRYGSVPCHVRLGKKIYSSVTLEGEANLVIGLEPLEALRSCYYGSRKSKTVFVVNTRKIIPESVSFCGESYPDLKTIKKTLRNFGSKVFLVGMSEKIKELAGNIVAANIYLLGFSSGKKLIPIRREFLIQGMKKVLPEKILAQNIEIFEAGENAGLK